jgi:oxaloacetate decarboxylase beta subunit
MRKRIFTGFLAAMVLFCSFLTCFAEGEDIFVAKNAEYNATEKTIEFDLANKSNTGVFINTIVFAADESEVRVEYPGVQLGTEIPAGGELAVKLNAEILNYNAEKLPKFGLNIGYIKSSNLIDMTQDVEIQEISVENIFDPGATPMEAVINFLKQTGFAAIFADWKILVMLLISFVLMYLAIVKQFEPLLLLPIAFGMLLTNLPGAEMFHEELFADGHVHWDLFGATNSVNPGLIDYLYLGVKLGIYPCLIFLGVGAMTDFGPLIANPKSLLLGAAAQIGIFATYVAVRYIGFTPAEAAATGIIGGADGPTAIFVTTKLAPHLLGPIAVAAYSYMALVPVIQPPIMKLLTTKKERQITMKPLREVSKTEKIVFPIAITVFVTLLVPSAGPLIGALMLGNLARECGVVDRISKTAQNELMNIVTIFLGISVGATATADTFLAPKTLAIICMGVVAFGMGSAGGVLLAKFMNLFLKNKINPLIGSAGVSAVPMAARVSQVVGQKENPQNFLLMHAMGPNVAGVIGSAIAAGVLIALFG